MREIKFRAWDKTKNEMIYFNIPDNLYELAQIWDCAIIMQYTGLKDKNGKEIYEGDVVKTDEAGWIAKVIWNDARFMCEDNKRGFSTDCWWERYEVIGNIYENPELIKEVK